MPLRDVPPHSSTMMRAALIDAFGGPDALHVRSVPVPQPAADEVLVRIEAAGINPIDWATRAGSGVPVTSFPAVLGWDLSGSVVAVGSDARLAPGEPVFGLSRFPNLGGAYAEYAAVPQADLAIRPPEVEPIVAGAAPMVALTAWRSLELAELAAGQRVLIHGAAGGVGHVAVQLAKLGGAEVLATASPRNHQFLIELGADQTIDYTTDWIGTAARDLDVILDPIGGPGAAQLLAALRPGGTLVTLRVATRATMPPPATGSESPAPTSRLTAGRLLRSPRCSPMAGSGCTSKKPSIWTRSAARTRSERRDTRAANSSRSRAGRGDRSGLESHTRRHQHGRTGMRDRDHDIKDRLLSSLSSTRPHRPAAFRKRRLASRHRHRDAIGVASYFGYFGRFSIDHDRHAVVHHIDGSWFPNLVGTDQVRRYAISDGELMLDADTPWGTVHIVWRKLG